MPSKSTAETTMSPLEEARRLLEERRIEAALARVEDAIAHGTNPLEATWIRWMSHMLQGDFEAAWQTSDVRLADLPRDQLNRRDQPFHLRQVWDGTPLAGRDVLVRCYHGLGDTIQFIRYVPMLRRVARSVTIQADPALFGLLATVSGIDNLAPLQDGKEPSFEVEIESMELPHAFRTTLAAVPASVPYMEIPRRRRSGSRMRIGLVWAAGDWDGGHRSVPVRVLAPLVQEPGADWVCLQRGGGRYPADGLRFAEAASPDDDLLRFARRLAGLDLVISVDTMAAHLAGALGIPVWTMLHFRADWRWMLGRDDSPWYPTMRLFRQEEAGDWMPVVKRIRQALQQCIPAPHTLV